MPKYRDYRAFSKRQGFIGNIGPLEGLYLLNNEECIPCNSNYSFEHFFIDCVDVSDVRQTFYNVNNLYDVFTNVAGDTILKFSKQINLYTNKGNNKITELRTM